MGKIGLNPEWNKKDGPELPTAAGGLFVADDLSKLPAGKTGVPIIDALNQEKEERIEKNELLQRIKGLIAKIIRSQRTLSIFKEELRQLRRIAQQIQTDPLTGAGNRCYYENFVTEVFDPDKDLGKLAIIAIDLDGFKEVNDNLGHATGDLILQGVAAFFKEHFRSTDLVNVVRMGGDEFLIICRDNREKNRNEAHFIEGLRKKMLELQNHPEKPIRFSFGIAVYDKVDKKNLDLTLDRADKRMYEDKESRKPKNAG